MIFKDIFTLAPFPTWPPYGETRYKTKVGDIRYLWHQPRVRLYMLMGICTATFPTPSMPCLGALVDMTDTCHSGTWPRPRACVCVLLVWGFGPTGGVGGLGERQWFRYICRDCGDGNLWIRFCGSSHRCWALSLRWGEHIYIWAHVCIYNCIFPLLCI